MGASIPNTLCACLGKTRRLQPSPIVVVVDPSGMVVVASSGMVVVELMDVVVLRAIDVVVVDAGKGADGSNSEVGYPCHGFVKQVAPVR